MSSNSGNKFMYVFLFTRTVYVNVRKTLDKVGLINMCSPWLSVIEAMLSDGQNIIEYLWYSKSL